MTKQQSILLPRHKRVFQQLGEQIKLARLRRKLSAEQVAERAGIGTATLWRIEKGDPGVAMGKYFHVLLALGLESDILKLASDDELGRKIQDADLTMKKRAPKRSGV